MDSNKPETPSHPKPVIGITIGDINGIGPEVIMKMLSDSRIQQYLTPIIYGSTKTLSYYRKSLELTDFNYSQIKDAHSIIHKKVNVINCWEDVVEINVGTSTQEAGRCSRLSLNRAANDLEEGLIDAIVTGPINKSNIRSEDFSFTGHTEFLAKRFGEGNSLMMMVSNNLKIALVTDHIPIVEVSKAITGELIRKKLLILESSLVNDFGKQKPRIAILGLNPHAGEDGLLGKEEIDIISPVVKEQKQKGKLVFGPFPADGFFGSGQYHNYDAILAMYHDQGLIPFKSLSFDTGVNYTAGIKIIRTSPDHGTAYSIAGKKIASETSMREALLLAYDIVKNKKELHLV